MTGSSDSDSGISSGLSTPTKRWREGDEYGSDEEDATLPKRRRISHPKRWLKDPNTDVPTPDDITDEMLDNVADYVSEKVKIEQSMPSPCLKPRIPAKNPVG